jgi:Ser/Thr protein kinase RdoA (MazF antagonist)
LGKNQSVPATDRDQLGKASEFWMGEKHILWDKLARRAMAEYGISNCALTFIRHSDTVTFNVAVSTSDAYLLRIHVPVSRAMGPHGADATAVNSELLWIEALSQDTDLVLQKPVRNRAGALVTQVPVEDTAPPVNCTLLGWVEGQSYHRDLESEHTAYQIGEILATLHNHASHWEIPGGFNRPKRDIAYFDGVLKGIQPAVTDGRIHRSDYAEFEVSIELLTDMLRSLDIDRQTDGIMHADTHKGNMLYHDGEIRLIDFSFCAFGNYMFDLGVCFSDMKPSLHQAFLEGYQSLRALPDDCRRLIEGFFVGSVVGTFSYWVANPLAQEILATKVPQIARDYAAKFNRGEFFWFS